MLICYIFSSPVSFNLLIVAWLEHFLSTVFSVVLFPVFHASYQQVNNIFHLSFIISINKSSLLNLFSIDFSYLPLVIIIKIYLTLHFLFLESNFLFLFLLSVCLRLQVNPQNKNQFSGISPERGFADFIFAHIILHLVVMNFIG